MRMSRPLLYKFFLAACASASAIVSLWSTFVVGKFCGRKSLRFSFGNCEESQAIENFTATSSPGAAFLCDRFLCGKFSLKIKYPLVFTLCIEISSLYSVWGRTLHSWRIVFLFLSPESYCVNFTNTTKQLSCLCKSVPLHVVWGICKFYPRFSRPTIACCSFLP